jgi:hypothetical protein
MAKTRTHLANRALVKLMIVGSGQAPEPEDTETADGVFDAMSETLSSQRIYTIADATDIELDAFEWLADYLAWLIAPDFGKAPDDGLRQRAEYMLRRISEPRATGEILKADYY